MGVATRLRTPGFGAVAIAGWVAAVSALTLQTDLFGLGGWIDNSWQIALQLANRMHIPFGSRLLFTYGPYGFLDVRVPFFTQQWLEGVGFAIVVHVVFVSTIAVMLWRRRAGVAAWIALGLVLLVALPAVPYVDIEGALLAVALLYLAVDTADPRGRTVAAAAAGCLLAVLLLAKTTDLVVVSGALLLTTIALLLIRRWAIAGTLIGVFAGALAALWWAAGLGPGDVTTFVRGAVEIGAGYGAAMYFGSISAELAGAVALLAICAALAGWFVVHRAAGTATWFLLLLVLGAASFKDDFVRTGPDRYTLFYAFAAIAVALSLVLAVPSGGGRRRHVRLAAPVSAVAVSAALLLTYFGSHVYSLEDLATRWDSYRTTISALVNGGARNALQAGFEAQARAYYASWLADLTIPRTATLDVMPWDTAVFYADPRLRWDPRPVLQSYSAYTPWLDQADASFLSGPEAPDFIVYSLEGIDDRYAAFDEPFTFRALLQRYQVVRALDSRTVLLQRDADPSASQALATSRACVPFGAPVEVPRAPGSWVFASIDLRATIPGRVLALVYRPPAVRITLRLAHASHTYRLVTTVAPDGLFVSAFLDGESSLAEAFQGAGAAPIQSLAVSRSSSLGWSNPVCVSFTSVASRVDRSVSQAR